MVQAWYMDKEKSDQRLENHKNPPEYMSLDDLFKRTGVELFKFHIDTYATDGGLSKLKEERGYNYEDVITISKETLENYDEKVKSFYTEHLHNDDEIRFILDGSGYFDVRDAADQWIRIAVSAGDMIIIPSGIYHRFTLDTNNYIKARLFFVGEPVRQQYNRPADDMECRKKYLQERHQGFTHAAL